MLLRARLCFQFRWTGYAGSVSTAISFRLRCSCVRVWASTKSPTSLRRQDQFALHSDHQPNSPCLPLIWQLFRLQGKNRAPRTHAGGGRLRNFASDRVKEADTLVAQTAAAKGDTRPPIQCADTSLHVAARFNAALSPTPESLAPLRSVLAHRISGPVSTDQLADSPARRIQLRKARTTRPRLD